MVEFDVVGLTRFPNGKILKKNGAGWKSFLSPSQKMSQYVWYIISLFYVLIMYEKTT